MSRIYPTEFCLPVGKTYLLSEMYDFIFSSNVCSLIYLSVIRLLLSTVFRQGPAWQENAAPVLRVADHGLYE